MKSLMIALKAETQKLKRTLALGLVFLAPAVILLLQLALYFDHAEYYFKENVNPWTNFNQTMLVYWGFLMLPLFITLESALTGNLEHAQRNWKLLYVQPVPRWAIYTAKQIINICLIGLSMLVLVGLMLVGGQIVHAVYPQYDFTLPFPWASTLRLVALEFLSAWMIISLQVWVSLRWPSFVIACSVGITATVIAVFAFGSDYAGLYPWTIPGMIATESLAGQDLITGLAIGLGGGLLAAFAGGWNVTHQEVL